MKVRTEYDVLVLGGGSAGTTAGAAAAAAGARVGVVNDGELGGLCILRGCMPTKTLLHSTHLLHEIRHSEPSGVWARQIGFDFRRIMERKEQKVRRFQNAKIRSVESSPFEVLPGRAAFLDPETVAAGAERFRAGGYVIATGSVPSIPPIPGLDGVPYMTSDDVMRLERLPASLVVQGAGPIGLELGQFFARLGARVLLVNRSGVLSKIDPDCSLEMERILAGEPGFELAAPGRIEHVRRDGSALAFQVEAGGRRFAHGAEALLIATGREPDVETLGLTCAGVETDGGRIRHDAAMRTSNPRVFVAGDATGDHQILHLANQEGRVAGHNAAGGSPERRMDYRLKMSVIFTDPPFATVGMTAGEAGGAGIGTVTAIKRFPEQGRAITMEVRYGLLKVVARSGDGEILGTQILGPRADDLIHTVAAMMHYRGRASDIGEIPWYHPTLAESFIEIGRSLAAELGNPDRPPSPPA